MLSIREAGADPQSSRRDRHDDDDDGHWSGCAARVVGRTEHVSHYDIKHYQTATRLYQLPLSKLYDYGTTQRVYFMESKEQQQFYHQQQQQQQQLRTLLVPLPDNIFGRGWNLLGDGPGYDFD
jgi:hypothetical protein